MSSATPTVVHDLNVGGTGSSGAAQDGAEAGLGPEAVSPVMADSAAHGFAGAIAKPYKIKDLSEVLGKALENKI